MLGPQIWTGGDLFVTLPSGSTLNLLFLLFTLCIFNWHIGDRWQSLAVRAGRAQALTSESINISITNMPIPTSTRIPKWVWYTVITLFLSFPASFHQNTASQTLLLSSSQKPLCTRTTSMFRQGLHSSMGSASFIMEWHRNPALYSPLPSHLGAKPHYPISKLCDSCPVSHFMRQIVPMFSNPHTPDYLALYLHESYLSPSLA